MDTITVYHGTTFIFEAIDVCKGKPYKDFGCGFYVTATRSHAVNLAVRNKKLEEKYKRKCEAYLYTYEMCLSQLLRFNVKNFEVADLEWLKFVINNRKSRERVHNYDIVIGPTADDETMIVINAYLDKLYGDVGSDEALQILLRFIKPDVLPRQFYFATNKSTSILVRKGEVEVL